MLRRFVLLMLAVLGLAVLLAPVVQAADAALPSSGDIAGGLVLVWGVVAPLTVYKWIPLDDARMKVVTMSAALVIGLIALVLGHQINASALDISDVGKLAAAAALVYGESQFVWTLLKDHPAMTKLVS